jgi:protein-disulfide isomerase
MASRTKQKEAARARRLAEEQARAAKAARQRRLQMLGGVVLAAIAVVAVAIAISSGGSSGGKLQTGKQLEATQATVSQLLNGIPQSGNVLGKSTAPVTVDYYGDLQCPVCQAFTLGTSGGGWPEFVKNDVRSGKAKVVYVPVCTATCNNHPHDTFTTQQAAALAAGQQSKFWDYTELFYHQQGDETSNYVNPAFLDGLAHQVSGLDFAAWSKARSTSALASQVSQGEQSAQKVGVSATPTLIFTGPKGKAQASNSIPTYSDLQKALAQVS